MEKIIKLLGLPEAADEKQIIAAITALQTENADQKSAIKLLKAIEAASPDEEEIREKMRAGLSRETAVEVLANQRQEDGSKKSKR